MLVAALKQLWVTYTMSTKRHGRVPLFCLGSSLLTVAVVLAQRRNNADLMFCLCSLQTRDAPQSYNRPTGCVKTRQTSR